MVRKKTSDDRPKAKNIRDTQALAEGECARGRGVSVTRLLTNRNVLVDVNEKKSKVGLLGTVYHVF